MTEENQGELPIEKNRKIRIEIDRSHEVEGLRDEIKDLTHEKAKLESTLESVSFKQFEASKETLVKEGFPEAEGLEPDENGIAQLKILQQQAKRKQVEKSTDLPPPPKGGDTAPYYDLQQIRRMTENIDSSSEGYDSVGEMISDLKDKAHSKDPAKQAEAEVILKQLYLKLEGKKNIGVGKNQSFELEGNVTELGKTDKNPTKKRPYFKKVEDHE